MERKHLKGHLEQTCPLQVMKCDLRFAGCRAQLQRRLMPAHMRECMQAHLSLLAQEMPILQNIVQQQAELIKQQEDQLKVMAYRVKRDRDQIKQMTDQIKQQGDQMEQFADKIKQIEKPLPPFDIIFDNFVTRKISNDEWYSPPLYTRLGDYKMCLCVYPNGFGEEKGTHVSVAVCLMRGEFDDLLKWPFLGEVTIQLKKTDPPHYQMILSLNEQTPDKYTCKPFNAKNPGWGFHYISHADLYAGGYLKDDKLLFCISDIVVKSK